jgi:hypothetical protein
VTLPGIASRNCTVGAGMSSTIVGLILVVPSASLGLAIGVRESGVIRVAPGETCAASKDGQTRSTRATLRIPHLHGAIRRPREPLLYCLLSPCDPTLGQGRQMTVKVTVKWPPPLDLTPGIAGPRPGS